MSNLTKVHPLATPDKSGVTQSVYDYDLFIIGGGFASLFLAKYAASYGARVCVSDMEQKWGSDDNVIKAFHEAALSGDNMANQFEAGWAQPIKPSHDWLLLQQKCGKLIKTIDSTYKQELKDNGIQYFSASASFEDPHKLSVRVQYVHHE